MMKSILLKEQKNTSVANLEAVFNEKIVFFRI